MESYTGFLDRIHSFEKKEIDFGWDYFRCNPSVSQKVNHENRFQPFYGDTIVFNLNEETKGKLSNIVNVLYDTAPECFTEKLAADTFHMTLHDLSNSPILEQVAAECFRNELKVLDKAKQIGIKKIKMKSKYIFNMVGTSLVLGLYPVNEEEYLKLMELYHLFDDVKPLPYPLTPHVTLAYYNVHGFDTNSARKLESIVCQLNEESMEIVLDIKDLYYQKFISMNEYINILNLGSN